MSLLASEPTIIYPKWKHLIVKFPSEKEFNDAWKIIFGFYPNECKILNKVDFGSNIGFDIQTPAGIHSNGGFGDHTESPETSENIFESYGCTWSVDNNGDRYYRIDKTTQLPRGWEEVKAKEIIKNFLVNKFTNHNQLPGLELEIK